MLGPNSLESLQPCESIVVEQAHKQRTHEHVNTTPDQDTKTFAPLVENVRRFDRAIGCSYNRRGLVHCIARVREYHRRMLCVSMTCSCGFVACHPPTADPASATRENS